MTTIQVKNIAPQTIYNETITEQKQIRQIVKVLTEALNRNLEIECNLVWWHEKKNGKNP